MFIHSLVVYIYLFFNFLDAVAITFIAKIFGAESFLTQFLAPILVACSCIGGLNGIIFTASRMPFAGARWGDFGLLFLKSYPFLQPNFRDGQLPEIFGMISTEHCTPMPSLIFLGMSSIAMLFFTESLFALINYLAFAVGFVLCVHSFKIIVENIFRSQPL